MSALENARLAARDLLAWRDMRSCGYGPNSGFAEALDYSVREFRTAMRELRRARGIE